MTTEPFKQYRSPRALEDAFHAKFRDRPDRMLVVIMQRFAARVCHVIESAVVKGGLGLDMRLDTPRTTKDADIIIAGSRDLGARLAEAGRLELGDFLRYAVAPEARGADIVAPGLLYPGKRYKVQARFASGTGPWSTSPVRSFAAEISIRSPAGFDVFTSDVEEFPQIPAAPVRVYSLHWQLAEKVHAYTDPRHRDSGKRELMRPRDLLDICRCSVAVSSSARIEAGALQDALARTFEQRKLAALAQQVTLQDLPTRLPSMPTSWEEAFEREVERSPLRWRSSVEAHAVAGRFLDPILAGLATGVWDPSRGCWAEPP